MSLKIVNLPAAGALKEITRLKMEARSSPIKIYLFGKFSLMNNDVELECFQPGKARELFCYLLLQRERSHSREVLASLLWEDCTTALSKKYLRQALWQLQKVLETVSHSLPVLQVDRDSVRFNPQSDLWLDVAVFENDCLQFQDVPHSQFSDSQAQILKAAVELYRADLLEGCYQDWCLFERERLQNLYLLILDKLMGYFEDQQQYEAGLEFGERILRVDRAHERTYLRMMRLHHLAGDRAGALRLYQRCLTSLKEELDVGPSRSTTQLAEQIRADCVSEPNSAKPKKGPPRKPEETEPQTINSILARVHRVLSVLSETQGRIQKEVQAIDQSMSKQFPIISTRRGNPK
jgi:DNA-binding SARP family transcriptional activator